MGEIKSMIGENYIIYGAGRVGKKIADLLLKMEKKVVMIWDRNPKKECTYRGIPVCNPYENQQIIWDYRNCKIIIGLANGLENEKIYQYLHKNGCQEIYPYRGGNIAEILCLEDNPLEETCMVCACLETCEKRMKRNIENIYGAFYPENKKKISALSIAVTNRCVLNCEYCAQCTEEIRKSGIFYDMKAASLKNYMTAILKDVFYIHELALTGGEALLCNDLPEIIRYLCELPQIGYIKLLTTATVELSDHLIEVLKNPKLITWIDDYGTEKKIPIALQKNLEKNLKKLAENQVCYQVIDNSNGTWYDLGNMKKREDLMENKKKNKECMFRTCLFLSAKGNLSWCSRNISCFEYGLIPKDKRDYCDLSDETDALRVNEILQLQYLHGCEYCSGTSKNNIVAAGRQREKSAD